MVTLELPNLGKHCMVEDCKQIDFLPFTYDRCRQALGSCSKISCIDQSSNICTFDIYGRFNLPDTARSASQKLGVATNMAYGKAGDIRNYAADKSNAAKESMTEAMQSGREYARDKANNEKETMAGAMRSGREYAAKKKTNDAKETVQLILVLI